jgi:hypothetical protein
MPRTTVTLGASVLRDLKRLQKRERKPLGPLISELLAQALRSHRSTELRHLRFTWTTRPMRARVDLADKGEVQAALGAIKNLLA